MMMTADEQPGLVEFLAARLSDDQAGSWAIHDVTKCDALLYEEDMADVAAHTPDCDCGFPARVLADIKAKRLIILRFEEVAAELREDYASGRKNPELSRVRYELLLVIAHHAETYDNDPAYQEGWRP